MNHKKPSKSDESLHTILGKWQVDATLPPRFHEQVWGRISKSETPTAPGWWTIVRRRLEIMLARPALATAYLAVLVFIGAGIGFQQGQAKMERAKSEMQTRYLQMVDPYQAPG